MSSLTNHPAGSLVTDVERKIISKYYKSKVIHWLYYGRDSNYWIFLFPIILTKHKLWRTSILNFLDKNDRQVFPQWFWQSFTFNYNFVKRKNARWDFVCFWMPKFWSIFVCHISIHLGIFLVAFPCHNFVQFFFSFLHEKLYWDVYYTGSCSVALYRLNWCA